VREIAAEYAVSQMIYIDRPLDIAAEQNWCGFAVLM
jgi:hypothetical protein